MGDTRHTVTASSHLLTTVAFPFIQRADSALLLPDNISDLPSCLCNVYKELFTEVFVAYRNKGAPWPLWRSVAVDGRIVVVCPAGPEPQD